MLVYLDMCCFNRPFDEQGQLLVRLQTEAKLHVQKLILDGQYKLVWSAVLELENVANPDVRRRQAIAEWRFLASMDIDMAVPVENLADEIAQKGIRPMDALHVASAIISGADWMLTTDRALLRKMQADTRIRVVDPVDFISQIEGGRDEA
jgi:predicted nucleic acid-binding protein